MAFVDAPNLPEDRVKLAVVDGRIGKDLEAGMKSLGIQIIKTGKHPDLYEAVAFHPDMMLHHAGGRRIVYAPGTSPALLESLDSHGFVLVEGLKRLALSYPADIAYNGARIGSFFFHNLKHTDGRLLEELTAAGVEPVHVNQGYAKCSVAIVDENSIFTSDAGIARAAEERGIEALLVPPQKRIRLPGLDYGFIGGCGGMTGRRQWSVFGQAAELEDWPQLEEFLKRKKIEAVSLSDGRITDYGSLLPLKT